MSVSLMPARRSSDGTGIARVLLHGQVGHEADVSAVEAAALQLRDRCGAMGSRSPPNRNEPQWRRVQRGKIRNHLPKGRVDPPITAQSEAV
jgi:hypothetical protein